MRLVRLAGFGLAVLLVPQWVLAATPQFLGVYAEVNGKLIELRPNSQGGMHGIPVGGADLMSARSGISLPEGATLNFLVYQEGAASLGELFVHEVAEVALEVTRDGKRPIKDRWKVLNTGFRVRLSPDPSNPSMLVRGVPVGKVFAGHWALLVGSETYDFVIGSSRPPKCKARAVGLASPFSFEVTYEDCSKFDNTKWEGALPQGQRVATERPAADANSGRPVLVAQAEGILTVEGAQLEEGALLEKLKSFARRGGRIVMEVPGEAGSVLAYERRHSSSGEDRRHTIELTGTSSGTQTTIRMVRGTTHGAVPQDLPVLMAMLVEFLGLDASKATLTMDGESKNISEW